MHLPQTVSEGSPSSPVFNWIMGDNDDFLASLTADTFANAGPADHDPCRLDVQAALTETIPSLPEHSGFDAVQNVEQSPSPSWPKFDAHVWSGGWSASTSFLDSLTSPTVGTSPFPSIPVSLSSKVQISSTPRRGLPRRKSRLNLRGTSALRESSAEGTSFTRTERSSRLRRNTSTSSLNSVDTTTSAHSIDSNASNRSKYNFSRSSSRRRSRTGASARSSQATNNNNNNNNKERRPFFCTFCCDSFKSKYDWARHEKSLHLSLERWVCTPYGGAVVSAATDRSQCAYCNVLDPTPDHLDTHHHGDCHQGNQPPVFSRKDHLVQHLRHVHHMKVLPVINDWKIDAPPVTSRCGFCDMRLSTWQDRIEHLASHFKQGKTMGDWVGEHGFEPAIAAQVVSALPPYIIGNESKSPVPFSATDSGTRQHLDQVQRAHKEWLLREQASATRLDPAPNSDPDERALPKMSDRETIVQILTHGLGRFARYQISLGIVPTDEMFQDESRRLVYGSDDPWNQTVADNAEWLRDFRARNLRPE